MNKTPAAIIAIAALALTAACGDEEPAEDPNAIVCDASQRLKVVGEVGAVPSHFAGATLEGELTPRRLTLSLGEFAYTPPGASEPDTRPRILVFGSNTPDPGGRELLANIERRIRTVGDEGRTFTVVEKPAEEHCDIAAGEICARFGLDNTGNNELDIDNVIHVGQSGTVTITSITATRIDAEWDITFGPNIADQFDTSSGQIEGCFNAVKGSGLGDNIFPLE